MNGRLQAPEDCAVRKSPGIKAGKRRGIGVKSELVETSETRGRGRRPGKGRRGMGWVVGEEDESGV